MLGGLGQPLDKLGLDNTSISKSINIRFEECSKPIYLKSS